LNLNDAPPQPAAVDAALAEAFAVQRRAADTSPPPSHEERDNALARLAAMLRADAAAFCAAIDTDFKGRAHQETRLLEIFPAMEGISHARRHLKRWMRPEGRPTNFWFLPGRSQVVKQPLGVVGIVVPWNYPLYLAVGPMVAALAAGNRVLVKMSEVAPRTAELFAERIAATFDRTQVAVVTGGAEIARQFVSLPFDHLLFTGSTPIGREVMRSAAAHLTPVTLELGGKSPAIVGRGADIAQAATRIMHGKCLNAGQTCIAPDYVLVPGDRLADFTREARGAVARLYPKLADNADYTAIVNERHRARLASWLDEARARGASVEEINPAGENLAGSPKLAPHLVLNAPDDTRVMREEIFGPILPLVPYRDADEAIAYVNARPRPLALYVFDTDRAFVDAVIARTVSGGVTVNETILHIAQEELPFGGVGPSGMGAYHGRAGFDTFSRTKGVFRQSRVNGMGLFRPPYGERFAALMRFLSR
jgi:acyl-CoA reductase-like NAD-dependent aldehyde dehydrogenase